MNEYVLVLSSQQHTIDLINFGFDKYILFIIIKLVPFSIYTKNEMFASIN